MQDCLAEAFEKAGILATSEQVEVVALHIQHLTMCPVCHGKGHETSNGPWPMYNVGCQACQGTGVIK